MKRCNFCAEEIQDEAIKCRFCGAALVAVSAAPSASQVQASVSGVPGSPPLVIPNYLWQAIVCTICCCWPLGIPAIVYAAQVNTKVVQGDIEGARQSSKNAKMWCWIALGSGLAVGLIYVAFSIITLLLQHRY